jgi:hypothetical protein
MAAVEDSSSASSSLLLSIQERFKCGTDGSIRDSSGQAWMVWNIVDFHRWWHVFETNSGVPLGRKLMHAAADQEEYSFNQSSFLQIGWLMKKKRLMNSLSTRWTQMGWGECEFGSTRIFSHLLAPVCSGFALAAVECMTSKRRKIQWHQVSNVQIQLEFDEDIRSISQAPPPAQFHWDSDSKSPSFFDGKVVQLDLKSVDHGWTHSGERTCFLPSGLFQRLFESVKIQGLVLRPEILDAWEFPEHIESSTWVPFILTSLAVDEVISQSERPIYIQDNESWNQLVEVYLRPFGLGTFLGTTSLDEQGGIEFELLPSPILPFTVAYLIAFWQRGFGRKAKVKIELKDGNWSLQLTSLLSYSH